MVGVRFIVPFLNLERSSFGTTSDRARSGGGKAPTAKSNGPDGLITAWHRSDIPDGAARSEPVGLRTAYLRLHDDDNR